MLPTLALAALASALQFFLLRPQSPEWKIWLWVLATLLVAATAYRLARSSEHRPLLFKLGKGDFSIGAIIGGGLVAAAMLIVPKLGEPLEAKLWAASLYAAIEPLGSQWKFGAFVLLAATAEELLWRGSLIPQFNEIFGKRRGWWLGAIAQGLLYIPTLWSMRIQGGALNPLLVAGAVGTAIIWGYLSVKNGRLSTAIVSHACFSYFVGSSSMNLLLRW